MVSIPTHFLQVKIKHSSGKKFTQEEQVDKIKMFTVPTMLNKQNQNSTILHGGK